MPASTQTQAKTPARCAFFCMRGCALPQSVGRQIVMSVGGASGPLFGTFFLALGKAWPASGDGDALSQALSEALQAVKARGRSDEGQKTLLDVLGPVVGALQRGDAPHVVARVAEAGARATIPMRAERGRAAFLGDRSVGHMDPGARTVAIMVAACAAVVADRQEVHA